MNAPFDARETQRRTSADDVFDRLRTDIVSLKLEPGTKLSEVVVAKQSDVSRQPVREAFIRLSNMNLLQIRPQKATVVSKISVSGIANARFIRTAVEVEVIRRACACATDAGMQAVAANLAEQRDAVRQGDPGRFHELDYVFHSLICAAAGCAFAADTIAENKAHVDRLCLLSLAEDDNAQELLDDHEAIFGAVMRRDEAEAVALTRRHLARLDVTLADARSAYEAFFED